MYKDFNLDFLRESLTERNKWFIITYTYLTLLINATVTTIWSLDSMSYSLSL